MLKENPATFQGGSSPAGSIVVRIAQ